MVVHNIDKMMDVIETAAEPLRIDTLSLVLHGSDDHKKSIEGLLWFELASFTLTWPFPSVSNNNQTKLGREEQMLVGISD